MNTRVRINVKPTGGKLELWMWSVQSSVGLRNPGKGAPEEIVYLDWKTVKLTHQIIKDYDANHEYKLFGYSSSREEAIEKATKNAKKYKEWISIKEKENKIIEENTILQEIV